jgi:hypothetical protein
VDGSSTNSVEIRGQRERGPGGGSPLVRGSVQFAIRFDFVKLSGCRGLLRIIFHGTVNSVQLCQNLGISRGGGFEHHNPPPSVRHCLSLSVMLTTGTETNP